jgi:glycosyltransferase involved in cell wall biosynthesis
MKQIAVLIPTYKRSHKLDALIKNFNRCSTQATLYFIVHPDDIDSQQFLFHANQIFFSHTGEYVSSINYGVSRTKESFILCGADDIEFTPEWDTQLLDAMSSTTAVVGGLDDWTISKSGVHISHPLVKRSWILYHLYFPAYKHYMCDIELIQRAWRQNVITIIPKTLIHHRHPEVKTALTDETHLRSRKHLKQDWGIYQSRCREFEMWDVLAMYEGKKKQSKWNPSYNPPLISIILPVFNVSAFVKSTLESIFETTYHPFELIIIDDASDAPTQDFINSLVVDENYSRCKRLEKMRNNKQEWVNFNWNKGVLLAEGEYIAILNSDVILSKNWDYHLSWYLDEFTITCPYEHSKRYKKPYTLDPFIAKYCPDMIKGACFMFKKSDVPHLFPIPDEIKHWCGDNWIADKANELQGVKFVDKATIYHYTTRSGAIVKPQDYTDRIRKDIEAYEQLSGKDMDWLKTKVFSPQVVQSVSP